MVDPIWVPIVGSITFFGALFGIIWAVMHYRKARAKPSSAAPGDIMDNGFFRTKYFVIPAIVAALLLAGGAWSYSFASSELTGLNETACDPIALPGDAMSVQPADATTNGGSDRTITWTLPPQNFTGGDVRACTAVGDIAIAASPDNAVHVEFHIHGSAPATVGATRVNASF